MAFLGPIGAIVAVAGATSVDYSSQLINISREVIKKTLNEQNSKSDGKINCTQDEVGKISIC